MSAAPQCLAPLPITARPATRPLPVGTCDTHMHVFGPPEAWPLAAGRGYTPAVALMPGYREVMLALGIDRAVLVQPSVYGTDNGLLLETLSDDCHALRGVVVVPPDITDAALAALHASGVRGIRFNLRNPLGLQLSDLVDLGRRIAPMGWHILVQSQFPDPTGLIAALRAAPVPVVLDHIGFMRPDHPASAAGFAQLCDLLAEGNLWVKLSGPYRLSDAPDFADLAPWIAAMVALRPDRLIWASDWPHSELFDTMQDDVSPGLRLGLDRLDPAIMRQIFVDNPARLYGFD